MIKWACSKAGKGKADHGLSQHGVWLLRCNISIAQLQGRFQFLLQANCSSYRQSHKSRLLQAQLKHMVLLL